jgi:hypothetical protein
MVKKILFLNSLLFLGLLCSIIPIYSIPVEVIPSQGKIYPIHVACECDYNLYVDGKKINPSGIVTSWDRTDEGVNVTNIFNPVLFEPSPKIIAFNNIDNEYPGFMNGFVMDMNNGKDYTKHTDWKCKYFNSIVPSNWMNYDYDDSDWEIAVSYGMNYQNNSYQIFEHERDGIHLNAEWLWTSVNSNPNIYCRKKRVDIEPYYVETKPVTTSAPSQTINDGMDKTTLTSIHTTPPHTQEVLHVSHTSPTSAPVAEHKPVVSPTSTTVAEHNPVVSSTSALVAEHKPVVSSTSAPVAEHKPVVSSTPTPVEEHKPVVTSTETPVEEHKPVVTSTETPVAEHKPVISSTATPVATHKPVISLTPTPLAEHKPVVSPTPTPVAEHKPVVSPTSTPVAEHKPVVTSTATPVAEHKPVVSLTSAPIAEHKPVVSLTPTPVAEHKPVVSLTSAPIAEYKSVVSLTPTPVAEHKPVVSLTSAPVAEHKPVVSPTPTPVAEHKPVISLSPSNSKNNIIIYQRITYVIQKFKYTQKHSYSHMENLIRDLKYINQNHDLYKNLIYTRNHLHRHYNTMFKELYRLRKKYDSNNYDNFPFNDDDDDDNKIPPFIQSMKILEKYIEEIEKSIQFIKGKYKYMLMNTLLKLKLQYREDTIKLLQYWKNGFN